MEQSTTTNALSEQAGKLWHLSNMFRVEGQETLAAKYVAHSFAELVFFTNSGTEAIEPGDAMISPRLLRRFSRGYSCISVTKAAGTNRV